MSITIDRKDAQKVDPLKKQPQIDAADQGLSPMDPPDAYAPPKVEDVAYEDMHVFLRTLLDEHEPFKKVIDEFENALGDIRDNGFSRENDKKVRDFFHFFDQEFGPHNKKEEKCLFPLLHRRLLERGEHSQGGDPQTPVTVLEADHLLASQQAAVIFNFLSLSHRLPDQNSRLVVLDIALEQGKELVELLRLHIFREETVVFPLAQNVLKKSELDHIGSESLV